MIPENTYRNDREQQLAVALQEGDQDALAKLYDLYAPVLLGLISRIIKEKEASEIILQKAFLMIWEQRAAYGSSKTGLLTWMIMLAKAAAIEALKSGNLNKTSEKAQSNNGPEKLEALPSEFQTANNTNEVFCKLLPAEKTILDLIYLKGYSCKEAAAEIGIPVETLIKNLRTAIKNLYPTTAL